jgi:hypothetical protein
VENYGLSIEEEQDFEKASRNSKVHGNPHKQHRFYGVDIFAAAK